MKFKPDKHTLQICYTVDDNFVDLCCASIYSIVRRKDPETKIIFYIIGDRLTKPEAFDMFSYLPDIDINVLLIDATSIMKDQDVSYCPSYSAWLRFIIPDVSAFKNIHRILYLDADIFARKDVAPVYQAELYGYPLGMVKDTTGVYLKDLVPWPDPEYHTKDFYCNDGLMLMDLDKFRKRRLSEKLMYFSMHRSMVKMNDQHVVNNVMHYETWFLPPTYQLSYHNFIRIPDSLIQFVDRWNNYHGTNYDTIEELIRSSYFWHFHEDKKEHMKYPLLKHIIESFMNDMYEFRQTGIVKPWSPEDDESFYTIPALSEKKNHLSS